MNLIIWLVIGGIIGWLASLVMKTDAQQGMILNIVVGVVGALLTESVPRSSVRTTSLNVPPVSTEIL